MKANCSFQSAHAEGVIRDDEVEEIIYELASMVYSTAKINPNALRVHLINEETINAFVLGGTSVHITTGLLQHSDQPEMLVGVLAHEAGHISGGHYLAGIEANRQATHMAIFSALASAVVAGLAGGDGDAVLGGTFASFELAMRQRLRFSRLQETMADRQAIDSLSKLGISPQGLIDLLTHFDQYSESAEFPSYYRTHPADRQRIQMIEQGMREKSFKDKGRLAPSVRNRFKMAVYKLRGFTMDPDEVLLSYASEHNDAAVYAKAVAYFRKGNLPQAMKLIDQLITQHPNNPHLYATKAQFTYESGKVRESISLYEKVMNMRGKKGNAIKLELASAYNATSEHGNALKAVRLLEQYLAINPTDSNAWRQLGIAYDRQKLRQLANLAFAEEAVLEQQYRRAENFVKQVEAALQTSPPERESIRVRLEDIRRAIRLLKEQQ
jgi:predicted Zn-dependent protease